MHETPNTINRNYSSRRGAPETAVMATTREDMEMKSLKEQLEALVLKVKQVEEERDRKDQEMEEIRGEQAMLQRRLSDQEHHHAAARGTQQNVFQSPSQGITNITSRPPKFPSSATKASSWVKRMSLFLQAQGLGYTIQHNPNPVPVISDTDRARLVLRHGEQTVRDHERAWCFLLEATADAPFEDRLLACTTLEEAWWIVAQWHMPATDSEKELLTDQLDNARMGTDEDPKLFFARVDGIINTLRSAGITKEEREVTRIIIRNLPEDYDVERRGVLLKPDISRVEVEEIVRTRHAAFTAVQTRFTVSGR